MIAIIGQRLDIVIMIGLFTNKMKLQGAYLFHPFSHEF